MRKRLFCISILFSMFGSLYAGNSWVRINQLGYLPNAVKVAVLISEEEIRIGHFQLRNAITETVVYKGQTKEYDASGWGMKSAYRLDFSNFKSAGGYYIQIDDIKSPCFRIAKQYTMMIWVIILLMNQQWMALRVLAFTCHRWKKNGIEIN